MDIIELKQGIFEIIDDKGKTLSTVNLTPGRTVYGEQLFRKNGVEFRQWNPYRSKLAAAVLKGLKRTHLELGNKVLYLGVASGTTCSHISDIVGVKGYIWGVDFAPRPLRDLIENLSRFRDNISPILADARLPESYSALVPQVDAIYADVAQPDQSSIVADNAVLYLKRDGWALMAVKSRSIDVTRPPKEIYEEQINTLIERGFEVEEMIELEPYEKDHAMVVSQFKG